MCQIEFAKLYVEEYINGNLLLDFTTEEEFIYFKNKGDYTEQMKLTQFTPSMLLLKNVKNLRIYEGDIVWISMDQLIEHKDNSDIYDINHHDTSSEIDRPFNLFMIFNDGSWLEDLFSDGRAFKNNSIRRKLTNHILGTWPEGSPCSLENLSNNINIEVVDVGQGSTNLIYDESNLAIFDFGASIFYSREKLENIAKGIKCRFNQFYRISLIISHWDCDHYNLLSVIDNLVLQQLCCVFFPAEVISLTAKQIAARLKDNCKYIRTFESPRIQKKGCLGIVTAISSQKFTLFLGTKSKDKNKSGLALAIRNNQETTILGADHTNRQIWDYIYPHTVSMGPFRHLNIVVPHHGGNCGKIKINNLSLPPGIAAISVGKNTYKHPSQYILDAYDKLGFDVKRTDWERQNIIITMKSR
ncbi:MAG: hypothetical protein ACI4LZ_04960 [Anaerovoracaceae bacterium]